MIRPRRLSGTMLASICGLFLAIGLAGGMWLDATLTQADADVISAAPIPHVTKSDDVEHIAGRWHQLHASTAKTSAAAAQQEELDRLLSMGYLQGSTEAGSKMAVTKYDADRVLDSLTLIVSGHAPSAELIDLKGNVLHTWSKKFNEIWPMRVVTQGETQRDFWRRAHVFPDGSLLAIFEYLGAVKLDANSRILWAKDNGFNHDISVADDGTIYMLEQKRVRRPEVNPKLDVMDDYVTRLTPDGEIIDSVTLVDCVLNSQCRTLLNRVSLDVADIFHANTLKLITKDHAAAWSIAKPGMVLVSLRDMHTIALVDLTEKKVVWCASDLTRHQHEPTVLPNGHIMVFDNIWSINRSRVIELDPKTQNIVWQYTGTPQEPFFSFTCSTAQYLPNGNRLITVSDEGRAICLDPEGKIVWEYVNPHRAGDHDELVATLFQCERLSKDFPTDWIAKVAATMQVAANDSIPVAVSPANSIAK